MLKIGEFLFKFRDYTPIPFVIVMIVFASTDKTVLLIGTLLILLGETIRIVGVSHIGGVSRTKTFSTGQKLITSGPFSHVRNPLYLGNFCLSVGFIIMSNVNIYFTVLFVLFFFLQYIPIIKWEENNLKTIFGGEFIEYKKKVPRWIPSIRSKIKKKEKIKGDFKKAFLSEKNTFIAAIILYIAILGRSGLLDFIPLPSF